MPAKLDRCVDKVMAKGKDKSSAFAICNKSLGLTKVAISSNLAKRVFDARYLREMSLKNYAATHSDPLDLIGKNVSLNKAKHLVRRNKLAAEKAGDRTLRAMDMLDTRKAWEANKAKYGVRNPTIGTKIKHGLSSIFGKAKEGTKKGLSSVTPRIGAPAPALQVA